MSILSRSCLRGSGGRWKNGAAVVGLALGLVGLWGCDDTEEEVGSAVTNATSVAELNLSPSAIGLAAGAVHSFEFTASGGNSNYSWSVSSSSLGVISGASNGVTATYRSTTNAGINTVTVKDGTTNRASASVIQD